MNRDQKRDLKKKYNISEETMKNIEMLNKPCTIQEAVQLARAASEDVCGSILENYRKDTSALLMAMTIQLNILKELVISEGIISEEEFDERYTASAREFEDAQREYLKSMRDKEKVDSPTVSTSFSDERVENPDIKIVRE